RGCAILRRSRRKQRHPQGGPHDPTHPPFAARGQRRRRGCAACGHRARARGPPPARPPLPPPPPARAAAPAAGKQAPGFYRYTVGSYEITVVTDGANRFPLPDDFVSNIKKDEVQAALSG